MGLTFAQRASDSPYIEQVWASRSENINSFISVASTNWDMVVWRQAGHTYLGLQGPETQASFAPVPDEAEFFGILFKTGTFMPKFPINKLLNGHTELTLANANAFWLNGAAWEIPNFENAETFVQRLVREELLVHEPVVNDVLAGHQPALSLRSVQRRFLSATGMSHSTIQQIKRARHAARLLQRGVSILDTVFDAGYFDQPHLTRAVKHFIGLTPAQLLDQSNPPQLSL